MKLPTGCSAEWCKEPAKQDRLLTWLEANPHQRRCLFGELNDPEFPKATCAINAAKYVFAHDENPRNSAAIKLDPLPFSYAVRNVIARRWRIKYQEVNKVLGRVGSGLPVEKFQRGSNIYKKCEEQMKMFPQWRRLHVFWRTLPYYNQFAPKVDNDRSKLKGSNQKSRATKVQARRLAGVTAERKRDADELEWDSSSDDIVEVIPAPTAPRNEQVSPQPGPLVIPQEKISAKRKAVQEDSEDPASGLDVESEDEESGTVAASQRKSRPATHSLSTGSSLSTVPKKKRARRLSNASTIKTPKFATETQESNAIEEAKEESSSQFTLEQRFQLQMAQLKYKTQREENIARQQEQTQRVLLALLDAVKQ